MPLRASGSRTKAANSAASDDRALFGPKPRQLLAVRRSMNAAIYARVSTVGKGQTTENQIPDLERLARARGFVPVIYEETESAVKKRPVFERMLKDCRAGCVEVVIVWALDRAHRSMHGAINMVLELDRLGVQVISLREPWLDTSGPVRNLLVAIFGWVAEQERSRLVERTKAGIARAKLQGKRIGRPPKSPILLGAAADLVRLGTPVAQAARLKGVKRSTLQRYLRSSREKERRNADPADVRADARPRIG